MRLHNVTRMPHDRVVPAGGLEIAGHNIPGGVDVGVAVSALHRRPEIFGPDVETYWPERWLEKDGDKLSRMRHTMFTFSQGKYNCLGKNITTMEMYKFVPSL